MTHSNELKTIFSSMLAAMAFSGTAVAAPITVDGSLSDWGVAVADNNFSQFTPYASTLYYAKEDTSDTAGDSGFVGPNYGGQNYDVEFLGVRQQGSRLYLAMVSGLRPDNGFERFGPGDIRIVVNGIAYGIEVGGGAGGGGGGVLTEGTEGSTYKLDANGFTSGHNVAALPHAAAQTTGSIWKNSTWIMDPIAPATPVQFQGGTQVGMADYVYTRNTVTSQHSIIEASFETGLFGDIHSIEIAWGPACGNDVLSVTGDINVPEPHVLSLLAVGLAGIAVRRPKARRR